MRNSFEKAMHFRHACKLFDATKTMSKGDLDFILDAASCLATDFVVAFFLCGHDVLNRIHRAL